MATAFGRFCGKICVAPTSPVWSEEEVLKSSMSTPFAATDHRVGGHRRSAQRSGVGGHQGHREGDAEWAKRHSGGGVGPSGRAVGADGSPQLGSSVGSCAEELGVSHEKRVLWNILLRNWSEVGSMTCTQGTWWQRKLALRLFMRWSISRGPRVYLAYVAPEVLGRSASQHVSTTPQVSRSVSGLTYLYAMPNTMMPDFGSRRFARNSAGFFRPTCPKPLFAQAEETLRSHPRGRMEVRRPTRRRMVAGSCHQRAVGRRWDMNDRKTTWNMYQLV